MWTDEQRANHARSVLIRRENKRLNDIERAKREAARDQRNARARATRAANEPARLAAKAERERLRAMAKAAAPVRTRQSENLPRSPFAAAIGQRNTVGTGTGIDDDGTGRFTELPAVARGATQALDVPYSVVIH